MSVTVREYCDICDKVFPEDLIIQIAGKIPRNKILFIAIGGPGGTGKSTLAKKLNEKIKNSTILKLDNYKTPRSGREEFKIFGAHPKANNIELIEYHLSELKQGNDIDTPIYDSDIGEARVTEKLFAKDVVIVDGEISTYREIIQHMDLSIFIDSHWKTQLSTRINRDIEIRGYTPKKAIETFLHSNLIEFKEHGEHTKQWCDIHLFCDDKYRLKCEALSTELQNFID